MTNFLGALAAGVTALLVTGGLHAEPVGAPSAWEASSPEVLQAGDQVPAPPPGGAVIPDPDQFEAAAPTDDAELEAQVRRLAGQLRCPTCQALSIADSPSELAREMEGVIRLRLQEGMTPEEVRQSFVEAYGEWVLLSPRPSGFNLLVYLLPIAVLVMGAGIVVLGMRKWLANPGVEQAPPAS